VRISGAVFERYEEVCKVDVFKVACAAFMDNGVVFTVGGAVESPCCRVSAGVLSVVVRSADNNSIDYIGAVKLPANFGRESVGAELGGRVIVEQVLGPFVIETGGGFNGVNFNLLDKQGSALSLGCEVFRCRKGAGREGENKGKCDCDEA